MTKSVEKTIMEAKYVIAWSDMSYEDKKILIYIERKGLNSNKKGRIIPYYKKCIEVVSFYSKEIEDKIFEEIMKYYGKMPNWVMSSEEWLEKIREIIE